LGLIGAALLGGLVVNAARRVGGDAGDFHAFFHASQALVRGQDPYTSGDCAYIYPPLLAFLYAPLTRLSESGAEVVVLCVNVALLIASVFLATREFSRRFGIAVDARAACTVALAAVLLTADKVKGELQMWQTNVLLLFLFTLALRFLDRRPGLAGLALGIAFNVKYWPIVALPYLLARRRWGAAAAFVASIVAFALLPATLSGWDVNLRNQAVAYNGLLRVAGAGDKSASAANVPDLMCGCSVSLTTMMARLAGPGAPPAVPLAGGGLIALAVTAATGLTYRRHGVPFLHRPDGARPDEPAGRALTGVEWAGLLVAVLLFSPQTNTRHLSLLLLVNVPAVLLLLSKPGVARWPLLVGTTVLALGLVLPPGSQVTARVLWASYGGPSWCELAMYATLLWAGLRWARAVAAAAGIGRAAGARRLTAPAAAAHQTQASSDNRRIDSWVRSRDARSAPRTSAPLTRTTTVVERR
jgi:hypothetical protein